MIVTKREIRKFENGIRASLRKYGVYVEYIGIKNKDRVMWNVICWNEVTRSHTIFKVEDWNKYVQKSYLNVNENDIVKLITDWVKD